MGVYGIGSGSATARRGGVMCAAPADRGRNRARTPGAHTGRAHRARTPHALRVRDRRADAGGALPAGSDAGGTRLGWRVAPDAGHDIGLDRDFWLEPGAGGEAGIGAVLSWTGDRTGMRSSAGVALAAGEAGEAGAAEAGIRLEREWRGRRQGPRSRRPRAPGGPGKGGREGHDGA